ncbi:hypothetical protein S245_030599, partial [Arachis hypogaea]
LQSAVILSAFIVHHVFPLSSTPSLLSSLHFKSFNGASASGLTPQLKSTLDKVVTSNKVVLFMKGTKDFSQCGFSNTVVQISMNEGLSRIPRYQ